MAGVRVTYDIGYCFLHDAQHLVLPPLGQPWPAAGHLDGLLAPPPERPRHVPCRRGQVGVVGRQIQMAGLVIPQDVGRHRDDLGVRIESSVDDLRRRIELGGSGMFRVEVTEPLGLEAPVIAWGLGLERTVMAIEGMTDIRQLYLSDIDWLRTRKALR